MAQLYDFLVEAELQQYYTHLTTKLDVTTVSQLKQLEDVDLAEIGMTRPEIRRLKKFLKKYSQHGALHKLRRILTKGQEELKSSPVEGNSLSVRSPPDGASDAQCMTHLIQRSSVALSCRLGEGEFGTVSYGVWKTEDSAKFQVAVKSVKKSAMKESSEKFLEEVYKMQCLDHAHVVKLYGAIMDQQTVMVVTELAPMKSLLDCLRDPAYRAYFPVTTLCELAIQIADGMSYLEARNFVHQDLAARNVLVFSKDLVKICDHGLTRALGVGLKYYQTNVSMSLKLPIAWCAPECITDGRFTSASDVWSYGVTLWEMFSYGFQPWAGFTGNQIAVAIGEGEGQRLDQPERCPKEFYDLMLLCWSHRPENRPRFAHQLEKMHQIKATRHVVRREAAATRSDSLSYSVSDVFTLLDVNCSVPGFWKGIHESTNKVGLFCSADTLPLIESKVSSSLLRKTKISRKESDRKSLRPGQRLHAGMISGPQNDLRHMGHVGHDGVVFGDVACVDQTQNMLMARSSMYSGDDLCGSSISLPVSVHSNTIIKSCSSTSLVSDVTSAVTSIISSDTLTDVSSMQEDFESLPRSLSEEALDFLQHDSPTEDFEDFRIPDISNSLDLGTSLMEDVMRVIGASKEDKSSSKTRKKQEVDRRMEVESSFETSLVSASEFVENNRTASVKNSVYLHDLSSNQNGHSHKTTGRENFSSVQQLNQEYENGKKKKVPTATLR